MGLIVLVYVSRLNLKGRIRRLAARLGFRPVLTIEQAMGPALKEIMRTGIHDEFQAGYAAALSWTWEQSGLPPTAETVGLHAMAGAYRKWVRESHTGV